MLSPSQITVGAILVYNDGRPGHTHAECEVLEVSKTSMVAQFEDRADTTSIRFDDVAWMALLTLKS